MIRISLIVLLSLVITACGSEEQGHSPLKEYQYVPEPLVSSTTPIQTLNSSNEQVKEEAHIPVTEILSEQENTLEVNLELNDNDVKEIKEGIFQTVITEVGEDGEIVSINFYTWEIEKDRKKILDVSYFNNLEMRHGLKIGQHYLDFWMEEASFFVSYNDLLLDTAFLETAKEGHMFTSLVGLGSSKDELISTVGTPIVTDWYHGGTYYFYNDIGFILDDNMEVVAINMPGNRISITLKEVPILLGEPTEILNFESENTIYYTYELGKYSLSFEATNEDKAVETIWLMDMR